MPTAHPTDRPLLVLALTLVVASCGSVGGGPGSSSGGPPQAAEGRTGPRAGDPASVAQRLLTADDLRSAAAVASLEVRPTSIELAVGDVFALEDLAVTARDGDGAVIPSSPFSVQLASGPVRLEGALLRGKRAGTTSLFLVSLADPPKGEPAEAEVTIRVR